MASKKPKKVHVPEKPYDQKLEENLAKVKEIGASRLDTFAAVMEDDEETGFYITLVFQNESCAVEFIDKQKDFFGFKDDDQIFVNGHELAEKLGTPLESSYLKKSPTMNVTNHKAIQEVGVLND